MTNEKLAKLKSTTAYCQVIEGLPDDYVKAFAEPLPDGECLSCRKAGTFTWGLVHGEGHCYKCGWPARLYHFVKDADGEDARVVRLLQYHPDSISLRETEAA